MNKTWEVVKELIIDRIKFILGLVTAIALALGFVYLFMCHPIIFLIFIFVIWVLIDFLVELSNRLT